MSTRALIAIDGSESSNRAIKHVADVACGCRDFRITLCHAVSLPAHLLEHEGASDPAEEQRLRTRLEEKQREWLQEKRQEIDTLIFEPAQRLLEVHGNRDSPPVIETKLIAEAHADAARAMCQEAERGKYDIVVVGRHGQSALKDALLGSVSSGVVHQLHQGVVWLVE